MLSKLPLPAEALFSLLSAEKWLNKRPKLNEFMKKLLADEDAAKAIGTLQVHTQDWPGTHSPSGPVGFFSTGHRATDIGNRPGGFSPFMCWPIARQPLHNRHILHELP